MIEIKEVKDLESENVLNVTDFEKYMQMVKGSEFGNYGKVVDSSIIFEDEEIPTKEVIYEGDNGVNAVVIFCASDESYITTEVR